MDLTDAGPGGTEPNRADEIGTELRRHELLELALDSLPLGDEAMLPDLWSRIAAPSGDPTPGTRSRRHPDWAHDEEQGISALEVAAVTAAELGDLLDSLQAGDWGRRTTMDDVVVRDIVEHLVGVDRYLLGQMGRRPPLLAESRKDHWPVARQASADLSDAPGEAVSRQWWNEFMELISSCAEARPDQPVRSLDLPGTVRSLLVLRTFELWTHGDDIRQALGASLNLLDGARLSFMSRELMQAIPIGAALTDQARSGRTARLCLTGTGGATFDVPLAWGETPGQPDVVVSVGTIELCRLAANRVHPDDLSVEVEGDRSLLAPVLAAAVAFAAD